MVRRFLRWIARLFGFGREEGPPPEVARWENLLFRFRAAQAQVREASTPDELEVATYAYLSARADLQWEVRMQKRDRGIELRPISENHRLYQSLIHSLRGGEAQAVRPATVLRPALRRRRRG